MVAEPGQLSQSTVIVVQLGNSRANVGKISKSPPLDVYADKNAGIITSPL